MKTAKIISIILLFTMIMTFATACKDNTQDIILEQTSYTENNPTARDVLKVGYTAFSKQFNPFYATTSNDLDIVNLTSVHLLTFDRNGSLIENSINGENATFNNTEYKYEGISDISIDINENGEITYDILLRENVKFSDGEILNADDAIFTMYVLADPSYDGPNMFNTLPIKGLEEYQSGLSDNISGIIKTDEYSFKINLSHHDNNAISKLDIFIAPMHYYGDVGLYNYKDNSFGFEKGNLQSIKDKAGQAFGAGAYTLTKYVDGVVYLERNEYYYKGTPNIKYIQLCETTESKMFSGVVNGEFDISMPPFNNDTFDSISKANGGALNGTIISTFVADNAGYGYIGINADNVKVGEDKSSNESKYLRKAFATLFSVYRENAVKDYYGDSACVIEYPVSPFSWAYPEQNNERYKVAYSSDLNGNDIFATEMSESEKYAAAFSVAIDYFKAAGFVYDEKSGRFISAPEGASLEYKVIINGDGKGNHPVYPIFVSVRNVLNSIGITLSITDIDDANLLWEALDKDNCQIWAAAWDNMSEPNLYAKYHSYNIDDINGSTGLNEYGITDAELDVLIAGSAISTDLEYLKSVYNDCYDIIFDWAVEIPVYQKKNLFIVNSQAVNIDTLSNDFTPYWSWINEVCDIQINIGY